MIHDPFSPRLPRFHFLCTNSSMGLAPTYCPSLHRYSLQEIIFPSWRGEKLEKFLAEVPACDTVGNKNDHYYDMQEQCRSCLMNLKRSSRGERSAVGGLWGMIESCEG